MLDGVLGLAANADDMNLAARSECRIGDGERQAAIAGDDGERTRGLRLGACLRRIRINFGSMLRHC